MIGRLVKQFGYEDIIKGMASGDFALDGGLNIACSRVNPFSQPGVIRATTNTTDSSTNATGIMIASAEDSQSITAYDRLLVDDEGGYYSVSNTVLTKRKTGSATTKYTTGFTDMVSFNFNTYVTLTDNISQWNTSADTLDETWWTGTKAQAALATGTPHPMLVFEGLLWVGDKEKLHKIDTSGTVSNGFLTLNSNERIQALAIDPVTGMMMISVQVTQNYSNTLSSRYFVYLFDGYSSKPRRKIPVDDLVTAFHAMGGDVYVGMGQTLGKWNGNGVSFLRYLPDITLSGANLLYKHHFASVRNILLFISKNYIIAYGEVYPGLKGFFPIEETPGGATTQLNMVCPLGSGYIGFSFTGDKFYTTPLLSTSAGVGSLRFNLKDFGRPIYVRGVRVITTGVTTAVSGVGNVAVIDESGNVRQPPGVLGTFAVTAAVSPKSVFDFNIGNYKMMMAAPRIGLDSQAFGIARVLLYYDVAE